MGPVRQADQCGTQLVRGFGAPNLGLARTQHDKTLGK